jgi:hypothetical protein
VRWERLFEDLESQLDAAERDDFGGEVADRTRRELALIRLSDRFRSAIGTAVTFNVDGVDVLGGVISRVGVDWLLLRDESARDVLVATGAVLAVDGLPAAAVTAAMSEVDARIGIGYVLRGIARDRAPVVIRLRDRSRCHGTIDRVGADFLDIAEHPEGEARRAGHVNRVRAISFAAISIVGPALRPS